MKSMALERFGSPLVLRNRDIPVPGHGDVTLKVGACGVCQTDLKICQGKHPAARNVPIVPGHEVAGEIVQVGHGVSKDHIGKRAVIYSYQVCGECVFCTKGRESLCVNVKGQVGMSMDGGYAEYIKIPADALFFIGKDMDFERAATLTDAVATEESRKGDERRMKIIRFEHNGKTCYGRLQDDIIDVLKGDIFEGAEQTGEKVPLGEVKVLPPVIPSKIIGLGLNYRKHVEETGFEVPEEPLIFLKPPSSLIGHMDHIVYPENINRVDYEAELGIVIGKKARHAREEEAMDCVLGYTIVNDVSARDYQKKDGQWTRGKGFDTFCPAGPVIVTGIDPGSLRIETRLNGKRVQSGNTDDLIFNCANLISFISGVMTLLPGDLIATGTPAGVGPLKKGDEIEIEIEGIGVLKNFVS